MNLLLTSAGISNTSIHDALVDLLQTDRRVQRPLHSHRFVRHSQRCCHGLEADLRISIHQLVRIGLEVVRSAGAHRSAQHQKRTLGPHGPAD